MNASLLAGARSSVDGLFVSPSSFGLPPTNYGQPAPHLAKALYEIKLQRAAFLSALRSHFEELARDMKADESNDPSHDGFPELRAYQRLGYPPLDEAVEREPRLVERILREWLELAVLEELSTTEPAPRFIFASLASIEIMNVEVAVAGTVFRVPERRPAER